jgi:hypothetical protein
MSNETQDQLIETQGKYIELLGEEINSMAGVASVHGWSSTEGRRRAGESLRHDIARFKQMLKEEKDAEEAEAAFQAHLDESGEIYIDEDGWDRLENGEFKMWNKTYYVADEKNPEGDSLSRSFTWTKKSSQ